MRVFSVLLNSRSFTSIRREGFLFIESVYFISLGGPSAGWGGLPGGPSQYSYRARESLGPKGAPDNVWVYLTKELFCV